ncbi:uncharacterized protein B0T15DRAFT_533134 [Chaetomium strumarium]|uniref:Uncharacterized protein n=1 Tax=Chaetomium strumarium TaxID=1170767 RepID=A0AAJ0GT72_9PEZI|nr:hypothetical protein B0T15DRAFT_533134 [Chaetomium strumarium]
MRYNPKPVHPPRELVSLQAMKEISYVPASLYDQVHSVCSSIPPPAKQYHGPKLLVPKSQLRRCQEWTREAVHEPRAQGILQGSERSWATRAQLKQRLGGRQKSSSSKGDPKASSSQPK